MSNLEIPEGLEELFQQTWFDHVLHYGLLIGAVFQLICIAAIVIIPPKEEENLDFKKDKTSSSPGESSKGKDESLVDTVSTNSVGAGSKKGASKKARKRK